MQKILLNPKLLIIVNVIPLLIYLSIFYETFEIVKPLLKPFSIQKFYIFAFFTALMILSNLLYSLYLIIKKKLIDYRFAFVLLSVSILYIYYVLDNFNLIFPSIPDWMLSSNSIFYIFSFLMPTIIYAIFIVVVIKIDVSLRPYIYTAIAIPIGWYLFFMVVVPLFGGTTSRFFKHIFLITIIVCAVIFLFAILKVIYLFFKRRENFFQKSRYLLIALFSLVLPLVGLKLNENQVFGDFSNRWFFILTLLNALFFTITKFSKLFL